MHLLPSCSALMVRRGSVPSFLQALPAGAVPAVCCRYLRIGRHDVSLKSVDIQTYKVGRNMDN